MCNKKQFKYCPSEIDECMKRVIQMLSIILKDGRETVSCCCGHGKYPMTLLVRSGGVVIDIFSGEIIPRKRNYYKKDKQGYYFIPETLHKTKGL